MADAKRDQNRVPTLLLVDDTTGEVVPAKRDANGRLLCLATSSGGGDVVGPASSTDEAIVRFDGTTGKLIQNSTVILDNSGNVTAIGNITGVAGGITITGGTGSGDDIRITSTSDATKGTVNIGSTTEGIFLEESTNRLSLGADTHTVSAAGMTFPVLYGLFQDTENELTQILFRASDNVGSGPQIFFGRSDGTLASPTVVLDGDTLGEFGAVGYDGSTYQIGAFLRFSVDGTPGENDMPARIEFHTTADGAAFPTTRLILDNAGILKPASNDGVALGTGALSYSDLFLASGGVLNWNNGDVTVTHASNTLTFAGASSGYQFDAIVAPSSNDGAALGSTSLQWSDLFLASGSVINFNNGDVTITHSSNKLDIDGGVVDFGSTPTVNGADIYYVGGTDVSVADGGTGLSSATAYAVLCGGTTSTGAFQSVSGVGTSGQVLTSNGASALPTWQTASSSSTPRRNMNIPMNTSQLQLGGTTSPVYTTSPSGIACAYTAGAGRNSYALCNVSAANLDYYDKNPEVNFTMVCTTGSATGTGIYWLGDTGGVIPTITQTTKSMFVILNVVSGTGTWYLVNANGTTNTNTSMTSITATDQNNIRIVKNSTTNIKCYVNYTLKATSTTNLPSGDSAGSEFVMFGCDNDAGDSTAREARFAYVDVLLDSPTT